MLDEIAELLDFVLKLGNFGFDALMLFVHTSLVFELHCERRQVRELIVFSVVTIVTPTAKGLFALAAIDEAVAAAERYGNLHLLVITADDQLDS